MLNETLATALTSSTGKFSFANVPPGTYSITFILGENLLTKSGIVVSADVTTTIAETVSWEVGFSETLVVVAPSRRLERIVEAPASVTRVSEAEIENRAAHGQLPKLLEFTPGAEVTQSGLYDFNFNTRGFNSSLNRRVATIIDGRNPSIPFLGAEEWSAVSFPLDDLASLEFVRGPSAALYGANASSGIINMTTKAPRISPGGMVRASFGQLRTVISTSGGREHWAVTGTPRPSAASATAVTLRYLVTAVQSTRCHARQGRQAIAFRRSACPSRV